MAEKLSTIASVQQLAVVLLWLLRMFEKLICVLNLVVYRLTANICMQNTILAAVPKSVMVDDREIIYLNLRMSEQVKFSYLSDGCVKETEITIVQRPLQSVLLDILSGSTNADLVSAAAEAAADNVATAALLLAIRGQVVELSGEYSEKFGKTLYAISFK